MRMNGSKVALFAVLAVAGSVGCGGPQEEQPLHEEQALHDTMEALSGKPGGGWSDCNVTASPSLLWPPNHKFHTITLSGRDAYGRPLDIRIQGVTQDEPVNFIGDGNTAPDAMWVPGRKDQVMVRAERSGLGDGRVYRIHFVATDSKGRTCTGRALVGVPHDQGGRSIPIDSGAVYDSFSLY
jgi:hypothetical protein